MFKMGSHCSFGHLKHKLWPKEVIASLTPDQKKSEIDLIYLFSNGVRHTVGKALEEGQTFALDCISIGGLLVKLWGSKVERIPTWVISGLPLKSLETKKPFGCGSCGEMQSILKGGRWWLPPSSGHGESCASVLPVACPSTKNAPTTH
jgi:hypothetical protein